MNNDARISVGLPNHPKTKKLLRRLDTAGGWGLVCLFLWVAANRSNGDLSGMSDEDIELAMDWRGVNGLFVATLIEVGFLDGPAGCRFIHDWKDHNPWAASATERSEASSWAALCKRYGRDGAAIRMPNYAPRMRPACAPHAPRTESQCDPDAPLPLPSPLPSPSPLPDQKPEGASALGGKPKKPKSQTRRTHYTPRRLPDWLPESAWRDWWEYRQGGKSPMTPKAEELCIRSLDELRAKGYDPVKVIENAIEFGWRGLYAPSNKGPPVIAEKPSAAANFKDKHYADTDLSQLPPDIRSAVEAELRGD